MPVKHWNLTCDSVERPITVPAHWRDEMMLTAALRDPWTRAKCDWAVQTFSI